MTNSYVYAILKGRGEGVASGKIRYTMESLSPLSVNGKVISFSTEETASDFASEMNRQSKEKFLRTFGAYEKDGLFPVVYDIALVKCDSNHKEYPFYSAWSKVVENDGNEWISE